MSPEEIREVLDFEARESHGPGKARRIRERFGVSSARYYHRLVDAIWEPAALAYAPVFVLELRERALRRRRLRHAGPARAAPSPPDARQGVLDLRVAPADGRRTP